MDISEWFADHLLPELNDISSKISSPSVRRAILRKSVQYSITGLNSAMKKGTIKLSSRGAKQFILDLIFITNGCSIYILPKTGEYIKALTANLQLCFKIDKGYLKAAQEHVSKVLIPKYSEKYPKLFEK